MYGPVPASDAVEDTGFSDVAAGAWYAEAVEYCVDNGLMSGTSATTFSPGAAMSRAMLATVLYREAGSPAVTGSAAFTDVADGSWYAAQGDSVYLLDNDRLPSLLDAAGVQLRVFDAKPLYHIALEHGGVGAGGFCGGDGFF